MNIHRNARWTFEGRRLHQLVHPQVAFAICSGQRRCPDAQQLTACQNGQRSERLLMDSGVACRSRLCPKTCQAFGVKRCFTTPCH